MKIADLGRVITGRTPPSSRPECFGSEYPFITPTDMVGRKKANSTERYVSLEGAELLHSNLVPAKSVSVSCIGWQMGKSIMTTKESFTNQQLNTIIPNQNIDPDFLYYSLSIRREQLLSLGSSSGVRTPILNKSAFSNLELLIPSLTTQEKIASVLSAYDDLIENNEQRIKILEEMAQSIYREWFVNYRFPGHENVRMVDSELGEIPEGWEVVPLNQLVKQVKIATKAGPHLSDKRYVPIDLIPRQSLTLTDYENWQNAKSSLFLFEKGDILFGAMRPYFHKVSVASFDGVTRSTCFVLRPADELLSSYVTLLLFQPETVDYASARTRGTTIPYAVWQSSLDSMMVIRPNVTCLNQFKVTITPILEKMQSYLPIMENLRQTRDLLLPKLISGELDVEELNMTVA